MNWERIAENTERCSVPGGWIVKVWEGIWFPNGRMDNAPDSYNIAMCFVPDPNHEWKVQS